MKILLVEDDWLQSESLMTEITSKLPNSEIDLIETELDFRNNISNMKSDFPDIILLDIMLRWTNPSPTIEPPPEDVKTEGFYNAGFRCQKFLSAHNELKNIPIILYSVLERLDLEDKLKNVPDTVTYVFKAGDTSILINLIKRITGNIRK